MAARRPPPGPPERPGRPAGRRRPPRRSARAGRRTSRLPRRRTARRAPSAASGRRAHTALSSSSEAPASIGAWNIVRPRSGTDEPDAGHRSVTLADSPGGRAVSPSELVAGAGRNNQTPGDRQQAQHATGAKASAGCPTRSPTTRATTRPPRLPDSHTRPAAVPSASPVAAARPARGRSGARAAGGTRPGSSRRTR